MKLALHACCGPCLIEPLDALREADEVAVVYANPNIHPAEEYLRRRAVLEDYAESLQTRVIELPYDVDTWSESVGVHGGNRTARCRACYRLRLSMAADWAQQHGYDALATTLSVSPWQDVDVITEEGRRAADRHGLKWVGEDYRDRYPEATRRSRELGMYRQSYCGCVFSEREAAVEREMRRQARKVAKEASRRQQARDTTLPSPRGNDRD